MAKMRLAVLFGGISGEHEISCISAAAVCEHIDTDAYEVFKLGITKKGRWLLYPGSTELMRKDAWETFPDCVPAFIAPDTTTHGMVLNHGGTFDTVKLDMVFPVLHGKGGEDGAVQGLLDLSGIPYVGCGVLSSAVCMDKPTANRLFDIHGIPHTPWLSVMREELTDFDTILYRLGGKMDFPIFVKPAATGSSLGVTKAHDEDELRTAIRTAAAHGSQILLEQAVNGHEVECAVMGNKSPRASLPGEIVSCHEIYDYAAKYQTGDASKLLIPAPLPAEKLEEVRALALRAYAALGCRGMARADFFVEHTTGRVLISELNTIPGFTSVSMYPKLMENAGLSFTALIDSLIRCATEDAEG